MAAGAGAADNKSDAPKDNAASLSILPIGRAIWERTWVVFLFIAVIDTRLKS
jgi:hypothetical protein